MGDNVTKIGSILAEARVEKGYTYADLEQVTKIQSRYLRAIDQDNFQELPGQFYIRAFVRQYAEAVDIDPEWLLAKYPLDDTFANETDIEGVIPTYESRSTKHRQQSRFDYVIQTSKNIFPLFLLLLFMILLIVLMVMAYLKSQSNEDLITQDPAQTETQNNGETDNNNNENDSADSENPSDSDSDSNQDDTEEATDSEDSDTENSDGPISLTTVSIDGTRGSFKTSDIKLPTKVDLKAVEGGRSWISVSIDGAVAYEGTLESGQSQSVDLPSGAKNISFSIGFTPSAEITIDGKPLELPEDYKTINTQYFDIEID